MVPVPESSYFPSLDKCLNGEALLISWKSVFSAIQTHSEFPTSRQPAIEQFLSEPAVRALLSRPFNVFPPATQQTKATFETRTSAINVTPSLTARYDIKQVKEDALWLSKTAGFDEVSALRIVTQECQDRASAKLLCRFTEEELASIRESAGDSKFSSPVTVSLLSRGADASDIQKGFESEDSRQKRILLLYLSERRYFLKCVERITSFSLGPKILVTTGKGKAAETPDAWLEVCGTALIAEIGPLEGFVLSCYSAIHANIQSIGNGSGWYQAEGGRSELEVAWIRTQITEATHTMEIIFQVMVFGIDFPSSQIVLGWFRLLQSCGFFDQFNMDNASIQSLILPLQSISMIISLPALSVGSTLAYLSDLNLNNVVSPNSPPEGPYILDSSTIEEVHQIMLSAADIGFATAGPALLGWSSIIQSMNVRVMKRNFQLEENPSVDTLRDEYQDVMERVMDSLDDENPIDFLARRAVNHCHALSTLTGLSMRLGNTSDAFFSDTTSATMRLLILELINSSSSGLNYIPEAIEALLASLFGGQDYWNMVDSKPQPEASDPVASFLNDRELVASYLETAMSRYPFEALPFLRMIRAVASCPTSYYGGNTKSAIGYLDAIPYFTYQLPEHFIDYETTQEEDNNNNVRLKTPVHLFEPRSKSMYQRPQSHSTAVILADKDFCIPAGTYGRIISDAGPKVVFWFHEYSGLKYFGKLLETFLTGSDMISATTGEQVDRDSVIEIIDILATILLGISKSSSVNRDAKQDAKRVLQTASSGLNRNHDIMTVVFDIFEEELQRQSTVSGAEVPLGVLVSCVHFMHAIISVDPGRIWPLLARSSLLGVNRGGGRLSSIVEGVELVSGRYDFLLSCIRLYESLVDDIASNAMRRRSGAKSATRFHDRDDVGTGVPDHIVSKILLSFTRYSVDVLESSFSWRFATQNDRRRLSRAISIIFDRILRLVYGIEASPKREGSTPNSILPLAMYVKAESKAANELASQITGVLIPSASQIVESFLSNSSSILRFQPMLVAYLDGLETPDLTIFLNELDLWNKQVTAVLEFSRTLLRVSYLLERPPSQLESQMFKAAPLIARLYSVSDLYKRPVAALFSALVVTANNVSEPPSLLGHLGPQTSKNFLQTLSDLDMPLARVENTVGIWHFLSMAVSNKQRWFANYLLTGKTPREAVGSKTSDKELSALDKPLLTTALEKLTSIAELPQAEAMGMLEFVALAQNFWPWTVYSSPKHPEFIQAISDYVGNLKPVQDSRNLDDCIGSCFQTRIAAYIAEILAMHLFHSRQTRTPTSIKELLGNLSYYIRFAVNVPNLNKRHHDRLKHNFEARYPSCNLQDLKRTTLDERQLGRDYFYDLSLADKMLSLDEGWTGRKNDGLRAEVEIVNVNLSLVDAQIALFNSWKVLAIEISSNISSEVDLQRGLIQVCRDCLVANEASQLSEPIFTRLCYQRADFALLLTQRLTEAKCTHADMKGLLAKTWETIRSFRGNFERALRKEDAPYYRSLLKLLFITTRAHTTGAAQLAEDFNVSKRIAQAEPLVPVVLSIIKYVVAMGIREIASSIHDNSAESSPEVIALLTGILQSCLRMPGIELCQAQIVTMMVANDTARIATTLFSWSDRITIDGDPVYGELSILFLLELSSMPLMAEQLALDGVLGHLASANITSYLRRGNVSPFAEGTGIQRCYSIWARGILPFLLNLLDSVQASIAAEVATFLNQFSPLLDQCSKAFEAPEASRTLSKSTPKYISLSMCNEAHSLSLINFILSNFRENNTSPSPVPEIKLDTPAILENVEFWLGARGVLRERILPMGVRDTELAKQKVDNGSSGAGGAGGSRLEEAVVAELVGIRDVLGGGIDV